MSMSRDVKRPTAGIYGPLRSRSRCRSVLALLATAIMFALSTSLVVAMEDGLKRNLVGRNPIHALKLRWIQKERTSKQSGTPSSRPVRCSKHINGSCVVRKHPDRQSVASWFGLNDHNVRSGECEHRNRVRNAAAECNHPLAGMTNPTLHIFGRSSSRAIDRVIPASVSSKIQSGDSQNDSSPALPWWPRVACEPPGCAWRVLRFHRNVGAGRECYQACRDAALAWEFNAGHKGIVAVQSHRGESTAPPVLPRRRGWLGPSTHTAPATELPLESHPKRPVQQIWWGPGRRLVTYTAVGLSGLPKIYTVSPVTVVYDVIDQRGVDTTYTSTAYATGAGHWIRGEERVTVCHRDADDSVEVEILSYSQAASDTWMGRLVWPVLGRMQQSFFQQQLGALHCAAQEASQQPAR